MSDVGFWCTADRGATYYNLNIGGARAISFLQRLKVTAWSNPETFTIAGKDSNSTLFVVPIIAANGYQLYPNYVPIFLTTTGVTISGNTVRFNFNQRLEDGSIPIDNGDGFLYFDVYQTIDSGATAGLYLQDASGWSGITNALKAGYCVYRTTVTIPANGAWSVPTSVQGRANCTVFANWSHPSAVVEYNNSNKTILVTGGPVRLNIAVFSSGFELTMPNAGFYIFNKSTGKCVYNSNYIPLFVKKTISFNESAVNTGVARPMVPLSTHGMSGQRDGDYYQLYNKGWIMNGQNIATGRGRNGAYWYTGAWPIDYPRITVPVIIADASQYFN